MKGVRRFWLCVVLSLVPVLACMAQTSDTASVDIQERVRHSLSYLQRFAGAIYDNPAVQYDRNGYSLTDVALGGAYRKESDALFVQEGDGYDSFSFKADSYIRRPEFVLWGKASYENARVRNVYWNETSDWQLLYPYLMADSVGGDMNKEAYSFAGGYAGRKNRFTWGAYLSYEATVSYRGIDPRPKNITSSLSLSLGGSYQFNDSYAVDVSVTGEKYKQSNELKFYSELGASKVYHLTGLGMHYVRFAGNNYETYYNGYTWLGSLGIHTLRDSGWSAVARFRYFSFGKIISSLNELPMADVNEYEVSAESSYKAVVSGRGSWGIKLEGGYIDRVGTENIFGDAAAAVYPQIASACQYNSGMWRCVLSGFYENGALKNLSYGVMPRLYSQGIEMSYVYPTRHLIVNRLGAGVSSYLAYICGRSLLRFEAGASYESSLRSSLQADVLEDGDNTLIPLLQQNYRSLEARRTLLQLGASYGYRIARNYMLRLQIDWLRGWYSTGVKTDYATISFAFVF